MDPDFDKHQYSAVLPKEKLPGHKLEPSSHNLGDFERLPASVNKHMHIESVELGFLGTHSRP